ncbi:FecR family protein [Bacteroides sp. Marseille-P3684]|uniref:FecR family protein n=1 Tax=Bacteroides sp. Marseille-P3684 TaxID=2086579 RepID=UPI000D10CA50|nr:FecR family protein [Bacteroides sp. Marseille-P3684]
MQNKHISENYVDFQAKDFVTDIYFLQWCLLPDKENTEFWEEFCEQHPEKEEDVQRAIQLVRSVRLNYRLASEADKKNNTLRLLSFIRQQKRKEKKKRIYAVWGVAASVLIAVLFLAAPRFVSSDSFVASSKYVVPDDQNIQLTSGNNQVISMSDSSEIVYDRQGDIEINGEHHDLNNREEVTESNQKLVVPKGKKASIRLSDGTLVWINSNSAIEFPAVFTGTERHLKVNGEVYLEVAKDPEKPFIVSTPQFDVEVLGTKFGVSSSIDKSQYVVLVEGSVQVHTPSGQTSCLKPSQMFGIDKGGTFIQEVDPYKYVSWKDNILYFNGESLPEVLVRLSQQYAVDLICNINVCQVQFYGKLVLEEHIENVLDNISVLSPIKYETRNNKIIVSLK